MLSYHSFTLVKKLESYDTPIKRYARKSKKTRFLKNWPQKSVLKALKKVHFWRCFCFSDHSKKFSTHPMTMFKVSRRCHWIISLRWETNQSHTTHRLKDMHEKSKKSHFLKKSTSKKGFESCKKLHFWRCFCLSDRSKKFSTHPMTMFKVSRRCPWIISFHSYKNQNRTTHQSKDIPEKPI